jgi:allantoinase
MTDTQPPAIPYPRDLVGHGRHPPNAQWPDNARMAVQFVLNYEEGAENAVLHGDQVANSSCQSSLTQLPTQPVT